MIAEFLYIVLTILLGYGIAWILFLGTARLLHIQESARYIFWPGLTATMMLGIWRALGGEAPLKMLYVWLTT